MFRVERLTVKDVMTNPVIYVDEKATVSAVVEKMVNHKVGSVIVTRNEKPIGIITEMDIVRRVVAKQRDPNKTLARDVMSAPLITVRPDTTVMEAARKMARHNIRRLCVVDKEGRLIGVLTAKDIIAVSPEIIEILMEELKEGRIEEVPERAMLTGYCDCCGEWSDRLLEVNGEYLCESCRIKLREKEEVLG